MLSAYGNGVLEASVPATDGGTDGGADAAGGVAEQPVPTLGTTSPDAPLDEVVNLPAVGIPLSSSSMIDVTTLDTDIPRGTPWHLGSEASVRRGLGHVRRFATQLCLRCTDARCRIADGAS